MLDVSRLIGGGPKAAVRRVGPATIGTEAVTMYRAETAGRPTTLYVDAHNRTRRLLVDRMEGGKQILLTIDVTQWGVPVRIDVPRQVVEYSAVQQ